MFVIPTALVAPINVAKSQLLATNAVLGRSVVTGDNPVRIASLV